MRAKDFIPANKPRNFVAKNAMKTTSGAGAHRDKKKEQKQGYEKHKNKGMAEGAEFGAYYSEQVAQEIFDKRQDITSEDEILNQAYHIVSNDKGQRSARYMLTYDEDFPSDVVSAYFWLQKQGQDMEEGRHGYDDAGFSLAPGHDEGEPVYNPRYDRTSQYDRKAKYSQDYDYNTGKPLGSTKSQQKKGYMFYNVNDEQTARKLGLKQTKSGKWYLSADDTFRQQTADKVFGKGRYWEPKS